MRNGHEGNGGISRLSVSGYKSLYEEMSIEIRPLTILAGANSSGKTSIMQPLLLMKQTLESTYDPPAALKIDGPNLTFSATEQLLSRRANGMSAATLTVEILLSGGARVRLTYAGSGSSGLNISEMVVDDRFPKLREPIRLNLGMSARELGRVFPGFNRRASDELRVERSRCFLAVPLFVDGRRGGIDCVFPQTTPVLEQIQALFHVPSARANLERTFPLASSGPLFPGRFVEYVATLLSVWQRNSDPRLQSLKQALRSLNLTGELQVSQASEVRLEVLVDRLPPGTKRQKPDLVNIVDVGSGVSQILPVLVALLAAEPGQLVYLEEPEMHLHPRAQAALAEVLADAARRGVCVVAETHSSLLLLGIEALVAEGTLDPGLVKLHWFSRGKKGVTRVASGELDDAGRFGEWPADLDTVSLDTQSQYLDAAEMVLERQSLAGNGQ